MITINQIESSLWEAADQLRANSKLTSSEYCFGRIYEYFLMKFAMQGVQDNGEFFTPPSLVRRQAVEQLKLTAYFHRQIHWLQERFPEAEMCAVPGLCKVVSRAEIAAADWSLTPGRYVGVAPAEVDDDFDFEQTLKDIHLELADLNREAVELAARIQENFEELGV
jgi:type I restriction-modification system DNA methylase subunit